MIKIRETQDNDINFIVSCLKEKSEDFANQCGYGSRFFTFPVTFEQIHNFQNARKDISKFFIVVNNETLIGSLEVIILTEEKRCSIARFLIADEYRLRGYGTETLLNVSDYAFNDLKLNKITLTVFDFNESALRCYVKAGFKEVSRTKRDNGWVAISMEKIKNEQN